MRKLICFVLGACGLIYVIASIVGLCTSGMQDYVEVHRRDSFRY